MCVCVCVHHYRKNRVPAILLLIPSIVLMGLSHALLAFTSGVGVLLFGTIGTAMAYGGHFAAYLFCINMYFGDKHYGQNVGWSGKCSFWLEGGSDFFSLIFFIVLTPKKRKRTSCWFGWNVVGLHCWSHLRLSSNLPLWQATLFFERTDSKNCLSFRYSLRMRTFISVMDKLVTCMPLWQRQQCSPLH